MAKKYREVVKALREAGFVNVRQTGSHQAWRHPDGRSTTIADHGMNKDVPTGTPKSIREATGLEDLR